MQPINPVVHKLAHKFMQRAASQGFRGKQRSALALEFFLGAQIAVHAMEGEEGQNVKAIAFAAYLIAVRGYVYLRELTRDHPLPPS